MGLSAEVIPRQADATAADIGGAGQFALSELIPWIYEAICLPGDWLVWAIAAYAPELAAFLQIGATDYPAALPGLASASAWLALLVCGCIAPREILAAGRECAAIANGLLAENLRKGRIAITIPLAALAARVQLSFGKQGERS
jgi:hypothetical protein